MLAATDWSFPIDSQAKLDASISAGVIVSGVVRCKVPGAWVAGKALKRLLPADMGAEVVLPWFVGKDDADCAKLRPFYSVEPMFEFLARRFPRWVFRFYEAVTGVGAF